MTKKSNPSSDDCLEDGASGNNLSDFAGFDSVPPQVLGQYIDEMISQLARLAAKAQFEQTAKHLMDTPTTQSDGTGKFHH